MFTQNTVTLVTAATGHRNLLNCLQSVQRQTYAELEHFVVIDGQERQAAVEAVVAQLTDRPHPVRVITIPNPTGKDKWCGHRIYAACSFLTNAEFISFVDEDNWVEPDHISSLMAAVRMSQSHWAFCLRNIYAEDGAFICRDECESLGTLHPAYNSFNEKVIDTNCYFLHREVAVQIASAWYTPGRPPPNQLEADRMVCQLLLQHFPRNTTNRKHTLNYTVGNRPDSVNAQFFIRGNRMMRERYPQGLPWVTPA